MKCVVVGGGGFIGSHLSEELLRSGNEVTIFDRSGSAHARHALEQGAVFAAGNFLEPGDLRRALSGCQVLFHLVSTTVPQSSIENPVYDVETNLTGSLNLLEAARQAGVGRVVFASSGGTVYGITRQVPIPEEHPTDPICPHGIVKLAVEKYLQYYAHQYGLDYRILRIANAYGERQPVGGAQGVISTFLYRALRGERLQVLGDGSVVRDYIYIGDVVTALAAAMRHEGEPKIFNISGGRGIRLNEIIRIAGQLTGRKLDVEYRQERPFDVPVNILDIERARRFLHWLPEIPIQEGMRRTLEWVKTLVSEESPP